MVNCKHCIYLQTDPNMDCVAPRFRIQSYLYECYVNGTGDYVEGEYLEEDLTRIIEGLNMDAWNHDPR